ncbi:MAG: hypothetical protein JW723_06525 [Bacteroidales bacterium]|nr:hypothetical protein [Bacteroidales bacterium]
MDEQIRNTAFDKNIIGINQDYIVKVRKDVLRETNGPMLRYGIQFLDNNRIILPRMKNDWPDQDRLKMRFETFLKAI